MTNTELLDKTTAITVDAQQSLSSNLENTITISPLLTCDEACCIVYEYASSQYGSQRLDLALRVTRPYDLVIKQRGTSAYLVGMDYLINYDSVRVCLKKAEPLYVTLANRKEFEKPCPTPCLAIHLKILFSTSILSCFCRIAIPLRVL